MPSIRLCVLVIIVSFLVGCVSEGSGSGSSDNTKKIPDHTEVDININDSAIIYNLDFNNHDVGEYTDNDLCLDWNCPAWNNGVDEGRVYIEDEDGDKVLKVLFPSDTYGANDGGAQWKHTIDAHDELYFAYQIKFGDGFDFVLGGKLPGVAGGTANTGSDVPDGSDGWSARMMWGINGTICQYVYHPDQSQNLPYGDKFWWEYNGAKVRLISGTWYHVETRVLMNTPGEHNGMIESWLNGVRVLEQKGLRFRDSDSLSIDVDYFSTFFGGSSDKYATIQDETIYFDNFIISTNSITH